MPEIKVLPEEVIAKIAAGEVIERPASVLKELLENAEDAGASHIDIEIEKAGRKLIRVRDDGKGMGQEDMRTSLLRHSTSKLRSFDDIYSLGTYGFRGEALYSVAAVSRIKMSSCQAGAETGFSLECEGGDNVIIYPAPPVKGTVIEACDLFFNMPARAKFLKSDASERAHLIRTAEEAALAGCQAAFRMAADGTEIFSVPLLPGGIKENLRRRTEMVLGKKTFAGMKEIDFEGFGIKIHGFVSLMDAFCSTRANQYYFVNRRPVASQMLKQAFYKAYPAVPMGKHPSCVLFLELDPSEFDVNVHPQKRDVKFSREGDIFRAFEDALKQATENIAGMEKIPPGGIYGRGIPPSVRYRMPEQQSSGSDFTFVSDNSAADIAISADSLPENGNFRPISPEDIPGVSKGVKNFHGGLSAKAAFGLCPSEVNEAISNAGANYSNPPLFSDRLRNLPPAVPEDPAQAWKTAELKYIGQLADSYLLFECNRGLLAVDQHAAQERVFFEKYLDELACGKITRQPLLIPLEAELTRSQTENVMRWKDWLDGAGFEIDARGPDTVMLRCAPAWFNFSQQAFSEFVSYLADIMGNPAGVAEEVKRNVVATMACKKAIKARDKVHPQAAKEIMDGLRQCRDGAHCPHGRPVMYYITGTELAKKFDRGAAL